MAIRHSSWLAATRWAACLTLVACASTGTPVTQTVQVETPGCASARCELGNDHGHWVLDSTPGSVTLTTSDKPLQVSCRTPDGMANTVGAQGSARPSTGSGGIGGGLVGATAVGATVGVTALAFIPPLGLVALATGAAGGAIAGQRLESAGRALTYPERITVPMRCPAPGDDGADALPPSARLGMQVRGLSTVEARSAGLAGDPGAVLVISVANGGRAAAAGVRGGDILLSVDGRPPGGGAQLEDTVRSVAGAPLTLTVWRDGQARELLLARGTTAP